MLNSCHYLELEVICGRAMNYEYSNEFMTEKKNHYRINGYQ